MSGQSKSLVDIESSLLIELVDQSPLPVVIARLEDKAFIYLSPGFSEVFGYTLEDTPTFDVWFQLAYPDPEYREKIMAGWQIILDAAGQGIKNIPAIVASVTCKDGSIRQVELMAAVKSGHVIAMLKDVTDRVKAEEALREIERYSYNRKLFETSPIGLSLSRMDGSFADVNAAFAKIVGYSIEEIRKLDYWALTPEEYFEEEERLIETVQKEGRFGPYEKEYIHKDGHRVAVRLSGVMIEQAGEPYMWASVEDISDRKKAERALYESERYNRMLFESSSAGLALNRMDGTFTDVNAAFASIVGYSIEEILSLDYWALTPEGYVEQEALQTQSLEKEGRYGPYEKEYIHKKGHLVPVRLNGVLIEQAGETYIWSSMEDISVQKKAELALRESEQRERARAVELETVLDSVPVAVFIAHDAACKVITTNRAGSTLVGVSRDVNPSKTAPSGDETGYRVLQNGVELAPEDLPMQQVAASGKPISGCPLTIVLADGTERHTLVNVAPLFDSQGKPRGAVGVFADITEQLKIETALRESEQRERARFIELETVLESVPLPIFISYDDKCSVMTGNRAAYEFIAMPKGSNPSLSAPEEQRPSYRTLRNGLPVELFDHPMHRAAATGQPVVDDPLTIIWEDGTERQALNSAVPLFDSQGKVRGAVGVSVDITEQLKVKKALETSLEGARVANEQLRFQFDHLPVAYIVWNSEFRVTAWNPAAEKVFGWIADEAIGCSIYELIVQSKIRDLVGSIWEEMRQNKGLVHSINENFTKDGKTITCEWFNAPLYDKDGDVVGCLSMANDITERISAEKQLRLAAGVFESCREAIVISNNDGRSHILAVNPAFTDVTGYAPEDVLGKNGSLMLAKSFDPDAQQLIEKTLAEKGYWQGEIFNRRKNGEVYPSLISISAVRDADGEIVNLIAFFVDMTERVEAETAIRRRTEQMILVSDALPFMVAYVDNEMRMTFLNKEFEKVFGVSHKDVLGQKISAVMPAEMCAHCGPRIEASLKGQKFEFEESMAISKGQQRFLRSIFLPHLEEGKAVGVFIIIEDITEQQKAEEGLRQSQKLQSIGTLAGGISHDLNNLLTPIIGLTEMVLEDLTDDESKESLQDVLSAAERAQRLVGQILAFSRKDAPNRRRLSLAPTLEKTIDLMRVTLPSNVRITRDICPAAEVYADETQMQQIIMNLCSNAAHAMGLKGGDLLVSLKNISPEPFFYEKHPDISKGDYVEILVRDTGYGMNQHTVSRIFEPFFTTKEVGEGTGMGLSVVHGIVTAHQGVIEVESELGQGATFRIFLPAAPDEPVLH